MFRIFLLRLAKNKRAKMAFLLFIASLAFAIIYNARFHVLNFWDRLLSPPAFDDPVSYVGRPYGFSENESKARSIFKRGTERFIEIVKGIYDIEEPEKIFLNEPGSGEESTAYLQPVAREATYRFFNDMKMLCPDFVATTDVKSQEITARRANQLSRKTGASLNKSPAIHSENYGEMLKLLLNLDRDNFAAALAYKPDFIPAVVMREEIHRAVCSSRDASSYRDKVLDYLEYKNEKTLFETVYDKKIKDPEEFRRKSRNALASNGDYIRLAKRHFRKLGLTQKNSESLLAKIRSLDFIKSDKETALAEVRVLLQLSRSASREENQMIFKHIFELPVTGLADSAEYAYALAEISYRAGDYVQTVNITDRIIKKYPQATVSQLKDSERLNLLARLQTFPE